MEKKQYIMPSIRTRIIKVQILDNSLPVGSEPITDPNEIESKSSFIEFVGPDNED